MKTKTTTMNQPTDNDPTALDAAIKELKMQVEINRRLAASLIEVRLELEQLKLKHGSQ
jgi:hypothetical protein